MTINSITQSAAMAVAVDASARKTGKADQSGISGSSGRDSYSFSAKALALAAQAAENKTADLPIPQNSNVLQLANYLRTSNLAIHKNVSLPLTPDQIDAESFLSETTLQEDLKDSITERFTSQEPVSGVNYFSSKFLSRLITTDPLPQLSVIM